MGWDRRGQHVSKSTAAAAAAAAAESEAQAEAEAAAAAVAAAANAPESISAGARAESTATTRAGTTGRTKPCSVDCSILCTAFPCSPSTGSERGSPHKDASFACG